MRHTYLQTASTSNQILVHQDRCKSTKLCFETTKTTRRSDQGWNLDITLKTQEIQQNGIKFCWEKDKTGWNKGGTNGSHWLILDIKQREGDKIKKKLMEKGQWQMKNDRNSHEWYHMKQGEKCVAQKERDRY